MKNKIDFILNFIGSIFIIVVCLVAIFFYIYLIIKGESVKDFSIAFITAVMLLIISVIDLIEYKKRKIK